ncbi:BtrH N-terminal domain-containing protein [Streptomyces sp. NPDC015171]|uniref:BtrH N-terminal domain-containing protein n=1 Tax=Streptomyces sp. NPDC015171 TaxID=3364945 RepID=UPI003700ABA0
MALRETAVEAASRISSPRGFTTVISQRSQSNDHCDRIGALTSRLPTLRHTSLATRVTYRSAQRSPCGSACYGACRRVVGRPAEGCIVLVRPSKGDSDFFALDCITATFGTVAAWLGRDPSVLGDDWGYRSRPLSQTEWPFENVCTRRRTAEQALSAWYGLTADERVHGGPDEVAEHLGERLAEGTPVIVFVDAFHMPYTSQYQQQHHCHRVVLRSATDDGFDVVDRYRGSLFEGVVEARVLLAAMSAPELADGLRGDPDWRHRTLVVKPGAGRPGPPSGERLRAAIRDTAAVYTEESGEQGPLRSGVRQLRERPEAFATPSAPTMTEMSAWFGELASQRALNARYLRLAAGLCEVPALTEAAAEADALARQWETIRNYFFLRIRKGTPAVLRIADMLDAIADREMGWNSLLRELLGHS